MGTRYQKIRDIIIWIVAVGAIPIFFFIANIYQTNKNWLPKDVTDLSTFVKLMPSPREAHHFVKDNQDYVELVAPKPGFPAVPSGDAIYVFNKQGNLVFWTIDSGDSIQYWSDWGHRRMNLKEISLEDALNSVEPKH